MAVGDGRPCTAPQAAYAALCVTYRGQRIQPRLQPKPAHTDFADTRCPSLRYNGRQPITNGVTTICGPTGMEG